MADSRRSVTDEEIIKLLRSGRQPVWTSSTVAEQLDITRQTAHARLKQLEDESGEVFSLSVGQATAYYVPGVETLPGGSIEEQHRQSIKQEYTDKFVGLHTEPWTAIHPNDGPAEGGDKVQLWIEGEPGYWSIFRRFTWENKRDKIYDEELGDHETQALITGELYEKPTVPVRHISWPDDYDLELNLGTKWHTIESDGSNRSVLVASGVKNYLLQACDNAVFLQDVSVDWISPKGEGKEIPTVEITREMLEDVEEWRQEHTENSEENNPENLQPQSRPQPQEHKEDSEEPDPI
ncbi:HTH domain-containing protein [Halosimplex pelagicum]|uniref:Helix-turn-helix transcriptional regulator n=1 Tax=Halosimplex pelagicum TaxID=869886 RepID=A0A7D5TUZ4_9EURY|nr:HTH domain-containing protein [Halosimplex pelagicum]QLH82794.1 helix-turn-helix transcriptional regulator [Halosimplex pelagicum]